MNARRVFAAAAMIAAGSSGATPQAAPPRSPEQAPRFLRVSADASREPRVIDPLEYPILSRRIAINFHDVSRGAALQEIAITAGLQFVYAGDVLPRVGVVRLQSDNISVAAALTEVLRGAGVDVAIGANSSVILVKKPPVAMVVVTQGTACRVPRPDERPLPLCLDGNGIPALKSFVKLSGNDATVGFALRGIAAVARVKITLEVDVLAMHGAATIPPGTYTVAEALLRAVGGKPLAIFVTHSDELSVRALADGYSLAPIMTLAMAESRRTFELQPMMGQLELSARELAVAPAPFESDLFRTVQLLPGVETRNDYSAGLNVRGGESDQNLILLDGYPIYNPFHLGGLLGTFIGPMVGKVDLMTGAAPVRYGERLSSVLDVQSADENRHGLHGVGDVSLLAGTATVGSAFDGGGSWMVGGRHTYADVIANAVKRNSLPYGFSDFQGHLSRPVFGNAVLSVTAYDGSDGTSLNQNNGGLDVSWGNRVLGATLTRLIPGRKVVLGLPADSIALVQRISLTTFDAAAVVATAGFDLRSSVRDVRASGAVTLFTSSFDQSAGYEISAQHVLYAMRSPVSSITNFLPQTSLDQSLTPVSGWYDALWRATPRLTVNGGVRVDAVNGAGWTGLSPRISIKYFVTKDLAVIGATGSYAQWLHSLAQEDAPVQPLEFWVASGRALPVSRAWQSSLGVEAWTGPRRQLRIEAFYKEYSNLIEVNAAADASAGDNPFVELGGTSYGADVLIRQLDNGRFGGWVAYSYSVSDRVTPAGGHFAPGQDRRHELNAVGTWKYERYRVSARLGMATGTPYTPIVGEFTRERYGPLGNGYAPDIGGGATQYLSGPTNSARLPFTHRLDVSITRVGAGDRVQVSPYLSIANVYAANNPAMYFYDYAQGKYIGRTQVPDPVRLSFGNLPFLPTIGVHIAY